MFRWPTTSEPAKSRTASGSRGTRPQLSQDEVKCLLAILKADAHSTYTEMQREAKAQAEAARRFQVSSRKFELCSLTARVVSRLVRERDELGAQVTAMSRRQSATRVPDLSIDDDEPELQYPPESHDQPPATLKRSRSEYEAGNVNPVEVDLQPGPVLADTAAPAVLSYTLNSGTSNAKKRAEAVSSRGAVKLTELMGLLPNHKDKKKGQQGSHAVYFSYEHIQRTIPFPDTSHTRYRHHKKGTRFDEGRSAYIAEKLSIG
ncbi:hypothetical protein B0H13DRAFT_2659395 [Mycena leptocephala]|nr:hypothetical protein B0H13DRAFT_2659395 [Mycena leptocephala]